ncbi:hypothetical protein OEB99_16650 [Actinotalea sp. M2MS4P-6]|uniref:hypothetical protein n=1 Tax=Actinotalea sp. M2MS4P-6 TaxID=2983762 RepID=UPI0021E3E01B|nr:hypothetical protein [Actinotalea sp. M2MS4P-6]MCV2395947.1 hypothetical protein [Actinotalea sp. M2MS4P-6]
MSTLLAIDPGNTASGWVLIDVATRRPLDHGKTPNDELLTALELTSLGAADFAVIEMVASYGMPVGADVFETCVWIGRFAQARTARTGDEPALIKRHPVKVHHCHSARANDANVRQALVDRFAPSAPNHGKGTKAAPGWFYGFAADAWQAYALAVYAADEPHEGTA